MNFWTAIKENPWLIFLPVWYNWRWVNIEYYQPVSLKDRPIITVFQAFIMGIEIFLHSDFSRTAWLQTSATNCQANVNCNEDKIGKGKAGYCSDISVNFQVVRLVFRLVGNNTRYWSFVFNWQIIQRRIWSTNNPEPFNGYFIGIMNSPAVIILLTEPIIRSTTGATIKANNDILISVY